MMRESMRSVEYLDVKNLGRVEAERPWMEGMMKGFLMTEPAMAEAKREAGTKFHPSVMTQPLTGAKMAASSRPPSGRSRS
jgi:hypothetical protein